MFQKRMLSKDIRKVIATALILTFSASTLLTGCGSNTSVDTQVSTTQQAESVSETSTDMPDAPEGMENPPEKPGGDNGGFNVASGESVESTGVYLVDGTEESYNGETITATEENQSTIKVTNGGSATVTGATLLKQSGDMTVEEASDFFGANAGILANEGSTLTIENTSINTTTDGSNAIFSTGEGTTVTVSNTSITTTGDHARGLDATYEGTIIADTLDITTAGAHCASIATDRGEGTVTVNSSTLETNGDGSPLIYSTGNITAKNTTGSSNASSLMVIEGKNAIHIENCTFDGNGYGRVENEGIDNCGVMIYQSMSGDASDGTGTLTAIDSTLTINKDSSVYATAPMFFVTNTDSIINLTNTTLSYGSDILLKASGNDGEWGTAGSNAGNVTLNAENQLLIGNVVVDDISNIVMNLTASSIFTGHINNEHTDGSVSVNLDSDSVMNLTGDCYLSELTDADSTLSNIIDNGYNIYYDASTSANSWLNGKTITLSNGGQLLPINS